MPLLVFGFLYFVPPFAVSWTVVRVANTLVKGPRQRYADHRTKHYRQRVAHCEGVEICPHGMSVAMCRREGRTECADHLRAQILPREFDGFVPSASRGRGLTENGEWIAIIVLTFVLVRQSDFAS